MNDDNMRFDTITYTIAFNLYIFYLVIKNELLISQWLTHYDSPTLQIMLVCSVKHALDMFLTQSTCVRHSKKIKIKIRHDWDMLVVDVFD